MAHMRKAQIEKMADAFGFGEIEDEMERQGNRLIVCGVATALVLGNCHRFDKGTCR